MKVRFAGHVYKDPFPFQSLFAPLDNYLFPNRMRNSAFEKYYPCFSESSKKKSWGLNGPHEISLKQDKHPLRPEKVQSENEEQQSPCVTKSISGHYVWDHFVKF